MKHWLQPPDSRICGQLAIACLTNKTPKQAIEVIGHDHGTTTKELISALRKFGWRPVGKRCIPNQRLIDVESHLLAQVRNEIQSGWHWVAIGPSTQGPLVYDGTEDSPYLIENYMRFLSHMKGNCRITSYLPVRKIGER